MWMCVYETTQRVAHHEVVRYSISRLWCQGKEGISKRVGSLVWYNKGAQNNGCCRQAQLRQASIGNSLVNWASPWYGLCVLPHRWQSKAINCMTVQTHPISAQNNNLLATYDLHMHTAADTPISEQLVECLPSLMTTKLSLYSVLFHLCPGTKVQGWEGSVQ